MNDPAFEALVNRLKREGAEWHARHHVWRLSTEPAYAQAALRRRTAYHEAGHCILARAAGVSVQLVHVVRVGPLCGETYAALCGVEPRAAAAALMAGAVAVMLSGEKTVGYDEDFERAARLCPPGHDVRAWTADAVRQAAVTLREFWPEVDGLRSALQERGVLSGPQLAAALDGVQRVTSRRRCLHPQPCASCGPAPRPGRG